MPSWKSKIIDTFDPRDREVILYEGGWDKCRVSHKEIKGHEEIKLTIESPNYIAIDKSKDTTNNYYKENNVITNRYEKYTKVCVSFEENKQKGKVATAYKCEKVHPEDKIIWKK
jgi:hypothetical protein